MRKLIFALLIGTVGGGCYVHARPYDGHAWREERREERREARREWRAEHPRVDYYYYSY